MTSSAVHDWLRESLLPRAGIEHIGFGQRSVTYPVRTGVQLLALCRLRYRSNVRDHAVLASLLWAQGFDIPLDRARAGLLRIATALPRQMARYRPRVDVQDAAGDMALALAKRPPAVLTQSHAATEQTALERGFYEVLFRIAGGEEEEPDLEALTDFENRLGLDRARADTIDGVDPWLAAPPGHALLEGLVATRSSRLVATIQSSTDTELITARDRARSLASRLGVLLDAVGLGFGAGFAGLDLIRPALDSPGLPLIVICALLLPDEMQQFLDGLPTENELGELAVALAAGRDLIAGDPDLAARAAEVGLVAALKANLPSVMEP